MKERIMIDASMVLHRDSLNQLIGLSKADALGQIVISDAFIRMIEASFEDDKRMNSPLFSILSRHFEIEDYLMDQEAVRDFLFSEKHARSIVRYTKENSYKHEVYQNLIHQTGNEWITQILFEEWEFLTTHSWLIAKLRTAFDKMVEAGGTAVYISRQAFETAVRRTIKKPEGELSPNDKLRATAKWVAVGGSVLAGVVTPLPGAVLSAASGFFLLCDP